MDFIWYSKCSTCKNAKKYLDDNLIKYNIRDIKDKTPTREEIKAWIERYNIDIDKMFNTSGILYRKLNIKDKKNSMSVNEKINILSENAMLIKRPILVCSDKIYFGFKEKEWETLKNKK